MFEAMIAAARPGAVLMALLTVTACGETTAPEEFEATLYAGRYTGTWTNLATGSGGAASITISIQESSGTASLTLDFDGNYLGLDDPPPATLTGTYDRNGAAVNGVSPLFGEYDVTIAPNGDIIMPGSPLAAVRSPDYCDNDTLIEGWPWRTRENSSCSRCWRSRSSEMMRTA